MLPEIPAESVELAAMAMNVTAATAAELLERDVEKAIRLALAGDHGALDRVGDVLDAADRPLLADVARARWRRRYDAGEGVRRISASHGT